jgi:hypothetical protein
MQPLRAIYALLHLLILKSAVATDPFVDVTEQTVVSKCAG